MDINRLHILRKGMKVERMHTIPHITPYNNGFHSCNAALIAHELCRLNNISSASTVRYMLLHDVSEAYVGDTPAYVKRDYPDVKTALDAAEKDWEEKHIPDMPDLHPMEQAIAKVSDLAELAMYCLEELELGNKNVYPVILNCINYLEDHKNIKGVSQFIDHFITRGQTNGS